MENVSNLIFFAGYRSKIEDKNLLVVHAGTNELYMKGAIVEGFVDGRRIHVDTILRDTNRSRFCYKGENLLFSCEYQFVMEVDEEFKKAEIVVKFSMAQGGKKAHYKISGSQYRKNISRINCCVDRVRVKSDVITVGGWAADKLPVDITLTHNGEPVECKLIRTDRNDITDYFQENELPYAPAYEFEFPNLGWKSVEVHFATADRQYTIKTDIDKDLDREKYTFGQLVELGISYWRQHGFKAAFDKTYKKIFKNKVLDYDKWIRLREAGKRELKEQRETLFAYSPLFSIVVPVYRPKAEYFEAMLKSVLDQTYPYWELCLADGSGEDNLVKKSVEKIMGKDKRVKYKVLDKNLGISGNTNAALDMTTGDFIVLGDHDDIIRPDALYECVQAINKDRTIDMIYTDEDKFDCALNKRTFPHFKPDFNLDMLRNNNYICHLTVFSRELYEKVGDFNSEFDGAQDYDFILRCTEKACNIKHIPKVLYTWRSHENSTAGNPESKNYAYEAGTRALNAYFKRNNIDAVAKMSNIPGYNDVTYAIHGNPKVSIIIPNKDHIDDLDVCIKSIVNRQDYTNYEIIIVENNSEEEATYDYYTKICREFDCVSVIYYGGKFNYSKINNYGAKHATGEYLLLLNNDTQMIRTDCLRQLLSFGCRPEVGIVGARLLYNDDTVQHAGVIIGLGGIAGHAFTGVPAEYPGYFARAVIPQNYNAVTAACLLVRKSIYDSLGGLDEEIKVAFNDVDFCLRLRRAGYLIVYNPYAELYHFESKSRGLEDTPEKMARFNGEVSFMLGRWGEFIAAGDSAYNPNLSLKRSDFSPRED